MAARREKYRACSTSGQVGRKIIGPLDPPSSDVRAPTNWTIHTVIEVHCAVVPVEGLFCLEGSGPGAIRGLADGPTRRASMRAAAGVVQEKAGDRRDDRDGGFQEFLRYWQKILERLGLAFMGVFPGAMGMAMPSSEFTSLTSLAASGQLVVPFHGPGTGYHPSLSGCSGRSPSGLLNSSKATRSKRWPSPSLLAYGPSMMLFAKNFDYSDGISKLDQWIRKSMRVLRWV
ncbi:hypothetical protein HOY80DRAFT_1050023 [Tuber brumale]|nr:hypothetical protein HOY80DRAFT_1050023 [Tuber brumale]